MVLRTHPGNLRLAASAAEISGICRLRTAGMSAAEGPAQVIMPSASNPTTTSQEPLVFMRFRPAWAYIDGVREFCRFFCQTTYPQHDLGERARVVLQETLENAVNYPTAGQLSELELKVHADRDSFEIAITSRPDPRHLQNLK